MIVAAAGPVTSDHRWAAVVVGVLLIASWVAAARRWSPPLAATLATGLAVRLLVAYLAYGHTPHDVSVSFHGAGQAVLDHRDPLTVLPRFQWNFLPFSAFLMAAEIKTGLAWQAASKILPIGCDLVTIALLGHFCRPERAANARLLYALSPLAVLVAAWHGQIEPIAVMLGLLALLLARDQRSVAAGVVVGLAAASKTWPAIFVVGVLRSLHRPRWWQALAPAALVLVALLLAIPAFLHDSLRDAVKVLTGYRSYAGAWGWSGFLHELHIAGVGYAGAHIDKFQRVGSALTVVAVVATIVVFRRCSPADLTSSVILVFLAVTAGFGPQYLLWPAALLCASPRRPPRAYLSLAGAYAGFFYLYTYPLGKTTVSWPGALLEVGSVAIIAAAIASLPWSEAVVFGRHNPRHRQSEAPTPAIVLRRPRPGAS